jgi:hypothetical protein
MADRRQAEPAEPCAPLCRRISEFEPCGPGRFDDGLILAHKEYIRVRPEVNSPKPGAGALIGRCGREEARGDMPRLALE